MPTFRQIVKNPKLKLVRISSHWDPIEERFVRVYVYEKRKKDHQRRVTLANLKKELKPKPNPQDAKLDAHLEYLRRCAKRGTPPQPKPRRSR